MARGTALAGNAALGGLLCAVGCAGIQAPRVAVEGVAATEATDAAVGLAVVLELHNPNAAPVELFEFVYSVSIDGAQVYTGRRAGGANLAAAAARQITLPAVINYEKAGWTAEGRPGRCAYDLSGSLVYTAPSSFAQILFDTGVRRPKVHFQSRGELALP